MTKIKFLLATLTLFHLSDCKGQENLSAKNSMFFEIYGIAGLYSFNYERAFNPLTLIRFGGTCFNAKSNFDKITITSFPIMITILTGQRKSHFELGGGILLGYVKNKTNTEPIFNITSFAGYRYQPLNRGILFRVGLGSNYPFINNTYYPTRSSYLTIPNISLGYHF